MPVKFLAHGIKELDKNKFNKVENFFTKPKGGLWASIYIDNDKEDYQSSWLEWIDVCMPQWRKDYGITFSVKENANIFIINDEEDVKFLETKYPAKEKDMFTSFKTIDFEKMSEDFDGAYLTYKGSKELYYVLYGWDVESLVLFNLDCIKDVEKVKIEWKKEVE